MSIDVKVPNIGDFSGVEIIEIPVKPGDKIAAEDTLLVLESDKATMEIPSDSEGIIKSIQVKVGEKVSEGDVICTLEGEPQSSKNKQAEKTHEEKPSLASAEQTKATDEDLIDVVVLGSGPGWLYSGPSMLLTLDSKPCLLSAILQLVVYALM